MALSLLCGAYERYPSGIASCFATAATPTMGLFTVPVCGHAMAPFGCDMLIGLGVGNVSHAKREIYSFLPVYVSG